MRAGHAVVLENGPETRERHKSDEGKEARYFSRRSDLSLYAVRVSVPVHVLPGGDGEGVSIAARPQQHVASLGLPLEQEHRLQTGNVVVTPGGNHPEPISRV